MDTRSIWIRCCLWLVWFTSSATAHLRNRCSDLPLVVLKRDAEGLFSVHQRLVDPDAADVNVENLQYRHLEYENRHDKPSWLRGGGPWTGTLPGVWAQDSNRRSLHGRFDGGIWDNDASSDDDGEYFLARECTCFDYDLYPESTLFCPMTVTTCREVINNHFGSSEDYIREQLRCETPSSQFQETGYSTALYILMTFYGVLLLLLMHTHLGRSALSFLPNQLTCGYWNNWQADRLVRDRELAMRMIWTHFRVRRENLEREAYREFRRQRRQQQREESQNINQDTIEEENTGGDLAGPRLATTANSSFNDNEERRKPTSLALKTRIYRSAEHDGCRTDVVVGADDEDTDHECIICMTALLDGDRVGALPCQHVFHVQCLKPWLQRCNACPMCKQEDVAKPNYGENVETTDTETDSQAISSRVPSASEAELSSSSSQ